LLKKYFHLKNTVMSVFLMAICFWLNPYQSTPEELVRTYLKDLHNTDIPVEQILETYYPSISQNPEMKSYLMNEFKQGREKEELKDWDGEFKAVLIGEDDKMPSQMEGLIWQEGTYAIYYEGEFMGPALIKEGRIISMNLVRKGSNFSYFLEW